MAWESGLFRVAGRVVGGSGWESGKLAGRVVEWLVE